MSSVAPLFDLALEELLDAEATCQYHDAPAVAVGVHPGPCSVLMCAPCATAAEQVIATATALTCALCGGHAIDPATTIIRPI